MFDCLDHHFLFGRYITLAQAYDYLGQSKEAEQYWLKSCAIADAWNAASTDAYDGAMALAEFYRRHDRKSDAASCYRKAELYAKGSQKATVRDRLTSL